MKKVIILITLLMFNACATIVSDSSYPLSINSNPPMANIDVTNTKGVKVFQGQTPATVKLDASDGYLSAAEYNIKITKPGYQDYSERIEAEIDPWYAGNLIFGGIIGIIVDPLTGAMFEIDESAINANLSNGSSVSSSYSSNNASVNTSNSNDAVSRINQLKSLKDQGILTDSEYRNKRKNILSGL